VLLTTLLTTLVTMLGLPMPVPQENAFKDGLLTVLFDHHITLICT